jgi:hypothetical protein
MCERGPTFRRVPLLCLLGFIVASSSCEYMCAWQNESWQRMPEGGCRGLDGLSGDDDGERNTTATRWWRTGHFCYDRVYGPDHSPGSRGLLQNLDAPGLPEGSRSWLEYGNFFIVALGILAVLLAFLVTMLFSRRFFENASQVLAVLTALFGVIGTLVGTYFGVKAGSDAAQGA